MGTPYLDFYSSAKHGALAFTVYPDDLVPTRERSIAGGSLSTFKGNGFREDIAIWPTELKRGFNPKFLSLAFGEVVSVVEIVRGFGVGKLDVYNVQKDRSGACVEFGCPTGATCAAVELFNQQLVSLRDIVKSDVADVGGICSSSWFSYDNISQSPETMTGRFWVYFMAEYAGHHERLVKDFITGRHVDALVSFQRIERDGGLVRSLLFESRLAFTDASTVIELLPIGRKLYALGQLKYPPEGRGMTAYSELHRRLKSRSLTVASYPQDLVAIRESSFAGNSLFDFKPVETAEVWPTDAARGFLKTYNGLLFGELGQHERLENDSGISLQFRCPVNVSCVVKEMYQQQPPRCGETWFAAASVFSGQNTCSEGFYVYIMAEDEADCELLVEAMVPGRLAESWVSLRRIDNDWDDGRVECMEYTIVGQAMTFLDNEDVPQRDVPYKECNNKLGIVGQYICALYEEHRYVVLLKRAIPTSVLDGHYTAGVCSLHNHLEHRLVTDLEVEIAESAEFPARIANSWRADARTRLGKITGCNGRRSFYRPNNKHKLAVISGTYVGFRIYVCNLRKALPGTCEFDAISSSVQREPESSDESVESSIDGGASHFAFKKCTGEDDGNVYGGGFGFRGVVPDYVGLMFGEVDAVCIAVSRSNVLKTRAVPSRSYFNFKRLPSKTLCTKTAAKLTLLPADLPVASGTFYVKTEPNSRAAVDRIFVPGRHAMLSVGIEKHEFAVGDTMMKKYWLGLVGWDMHDAGYIPSRNSPSYLCTLTDYVATRDSSGPRQTSIFTFKSTKETCQGWMHVRERQPRFQSTVFGLLEDVVTMGDGDTFAVKLGCPPGAGRATEHLYLEQIQALQDILKQDAADGPIIIGASWFDGISSGSEPGFWVILTALSPEQPADLGVRLRQGVGGLLQSFVTLRRIDHDNGIKRTDYAILAFRHRLETYMGHFWPYALKPQTTDVYGNQSFIAPYYPSSSILP
ncbi:hypothetical protein C8F04DRAFT_1184049 [Mycena alexandri]|nr:hypothetical protein C8F04DRAFT_1184049 [Mycena alexandri]